MFSCRVGGALLGLLLAAPTYAFYLPGAAPRSYKEGDKVELFVNALTPFISGAEDAKLVRVECPERENAMLITLVWCRNLSSTVSWAQADLCDALHC